MAEGTSNPDEPDLKCYHMLKYSRFGEFGGAYGQFRSPWGAAISTGLEIIVADTKNNRLQILDLEGNFKRQIQGVDQFGLPFPKHPVKLAVDFRNGNIFMVEVDCYHGIVMFNSDEEMLSSIGDFNYPANAVCLTVDNKSNVLLVEQCESSIFLKIMRMTEPHSRIDISAHVKRPNSIAASDETFYITDCEIKAVQVRNVSCTCLVSRQHILTCLVQLSFILLYCFKQRLMYTEKDHPVYCLLSNHFLKLCCIISATMLENSMQLFPTAYFQLSYSNDLATFKDLRI